MASSRGGVLSAHHNRTSQRNGTHHSPRADQRQLATRASGIEWWERSASKLVPQPCQTTSCHSRDEESSSHEVCTRRHRIRTNGAVVRGAARLRGVPRLSTKNRPSHPRRRSPRRPQYSGSLSHSGNPAPRSLRDEIRNVRTQRAHSTSHQSVPRVP